MATSQVIRRFTWHNSEVTDPSIDPQLLTRSHLSADSWTAVCVTDPERSHDVLLTSGRTAAELRESLAEQRLQFPDGAVLVVVGFDAVAELVVVALESGADGCVRDYDPVVVRAHLSALHRRRRQVPVAG